MRTLAVIPARGGSKRLPGKNMRDFLGKPLIGWTLEFALKLEESFDRTVVSTDCKETANYVSGAWNNAKIDFRPAHLATDTAATVDVALDLLERESRNSRIYDAVAILQPTSPLRAVARWKSAFKILDDNLFEAVIGVANVSQHPFHVFKFNRGGGLVPWYDKAALALRSQELPSAVYVTGSLYLIKTDALIRNRSFFPDKIAGSAAKHDWEAIDIDTQEDWTRAEALVRKALRGT